MTTDQLLEALKPYGVDLQWGVNPKQWSVLLMDWHWAYFTGSTPQAALQQAYDAVMQEIRENG